MSKSNPSTPSKAPNLPKRLRHADRRYLPKRQRRTIKTNAVKASDLRRFEPRIFCDECSHYSETQKRCTLGYRAQHTRAEQTALYNLTGTLAFCRMMEID